MQVNGQVHLLENLKSVLSAKYLKKLSAYENMLYSSGLAEDIYISFLEDSPANPAAEQVLDSIFEQGLKHQKDLSENFIETIKSFHQNDYTSSHLKVLV